MVVRPATGASDFKVNGEAVAPKSYNVDPTMLAGATLQVGKRHFAKLV